MQRLILAVYQLIGTLLLPILVIALVIRSRKQPAYRSRIYERLGFSRKSAHQGNIIIHGASLGEITSLKPFVLSALEQSPNKTIYVTSFTPAGSRQVEKLFAEKVRHIYLPFDSPICNWLFLRNTKPCAVVFMETELWPSLAHQIKSYGAKLLLINARVSEKSIVNYKKVRPLIKSTLNQFDKISAQTEKNKANFIELGASTNRVFVGGNLKFDIAKQETTQLKANVIRDQLGNRFAWVIGSSHTDEEDIFLEAFTTLKNLIPNMLLIIAPRHPERYKPLMDKLELAHITYQIRSEQLPKQGINYSADIWLIDTTGELLLFYAVSDISTVAGSFDNTGGHNILEPALFGKAITTGPNMKSNYEVTQMLIKEHAILQHKDNLAQTLVNDIHGLFCSKEERTQLGENALSLLNMHRGATVRNIQYLASLIDN